MNREKVIKGLECCIKAVKDIMELKDPICTPCPYSKGHEFCCEDLKMDALVLLKEQTETIENREQEIRDKNERLKERAEQVDSLLKGQEAVQPNNVRKSSSYVYSSQLIGYCKKCGTKINSIDNRSACGKCGQAVKWDD